MASKVTLLLMVVMLAAVTSFAGEEKESAPEQMTLEGKLVCLGCDLKSNEGARSSCSEFGHTHAIKSADGKYIGFLPNKFSKDLLKGEKYHNADLSVNGAFHATANLMDVHSFQVGGGGNELVRSLQGHGRLHGQEVNSERSDQYAD